MNIYAYMPTGSRKRLGVSQETRVKIGEQGNVHKRDPVPALKIEY